MGQRTHSVSNLFWKPRSDVFYCNGRIFDCIMQKCYSLGYWVAFYAFCYNRNVRFEIILPGLVFLPSMSLNSPALALATISMSDCFVMAYPLNLLFL